MGGCCLDPSATCRKNRGTSVGMTDWGKLAEELEFAEKEREKSGECLT